MLPIVIIQKPYRAATARREMPVASLALAGYYRKGRRRMGFLDDFKKLLDERDPEKEKNLFDAIDRLGVAVSKLGTHYIFSHPAVIVTYSIRDSKKTTSSINQTLREMFDANRNIDVRKYQSSLGIVVIKVERNNAPSDSGIYGSS